jgi:hypothetical protein
MNHKSHEDKIEFLEECAEIEGSELGEGLLSLIEVYRYRYVFSDEFSMAIEMEIDSMYEYMSSNFKIVEQEIEVVNKIKTRDLVEKNGSWIKKT